MTETGSTNADLLAEGRDGAPAGLVLVADHQTAGRGRQARRWHDEPGAAVLMSVLLRPGPEVAPLIPLLMGLAALEAAGSVPSDPDSSDPESLSGRLGLKWPNDLLVPDLGDRKLAGILAEATTVSPTSGADSAADPATAPGPESRLVVVVGIGLNLRWSAPPPADVRARAVTLETLAGRDVDRWEVINAVLARFDQWLDVAETSGPGPVLDAYRRRCVTIGRDITLETPSGVIEGRATGVADSGALQVATATGTIEVLAGEAHHR